MEVEKYFLLSVKRTLAIIGIWVLAVILHNLVSALFYDFSKGADEPVFFVIAVFAIPLYFLASIGYTIYNHVKK